VVAVVVVVVVGLVWCGGLGCGGFGLIVDVLSIWQYLELSKISRFSTLFHRVCVLCSLSGAIALDVPARVRV